MDGLTVSVLTNLASLVVVVLTAIKLYYSAIKKVAEIEVAAGNLDTFRSEIEARIDTVRVTVSDAAIATHNSVANIERKLESFEEKYVRKDVHDAQMQLMNVRITPLEKAHEIRPHAEVRRKRKRLPA